MSPARALIAVALLALAACGGGKPGADGAGKAGTAAPALDLRGTYWKLVLLGGAKVKPAADAQREPHLVFATDADRVTGSGGCNRVSGTFTLAADQLAFAPLVSTRMACATGGELEAFFLIALGGVSHYRISGSTLEMLDSAGGLVLRFEAATPPAPPPV